MRSRAAKQFWSSFAALPVHVQEQARKAFELWESDPRHPSLHFKHVHSRRPLYSVRIGAHWRALGLLEGDEMRWFWIGPHPEYERVIRRF